MWRKGNLYNMRKITIKKIFYIILFGSLLIWGISIVITHASSLHLYLWHPGSSFYDFFSCIKENIYWNRRRIYEKGSIYPPLANLIYVLISRCMSSSTLKEIEGLSAINEIKKLQECSLYFVLYMNILLVAYFNICYKLKKGSETEKTLFTIGMLFTIPFIYQFERANIIFLALILLMLFLLWKDSKNLVKREIALFALAVSAAIKIYPAVFGIVLLKEKRFKEVIRLMIYGIVLFVMPFCFFGGIQKNLILLLENLSNTANQFSSTRLGCQLDFFTTFRYLFQKMGSKGNFFAGTLRLVFTALGFFSVFFQKRVWKSFLLMVCLMIGVPSISYTYTAIFIIVPIIYFLDYDEIKKSDILYLIGMLLVILPIPFCWTEGVGDFNYSYMNVTVPMFIEEITIVMMSLALIIEGMLTFVCKYGKYLKTGFLIATIMFSIKENRPLLDESYAYTDYLKKTLSDKITLQPGDFLEQSFIPRKNCIDYIVIKIKSKGTGRLIIDLIERDTGNSVLKKKCNLFEFNDGYNKISLDNMLVKKGEGYQLKLTYENKDDEKVEIWKTVENYKDVDNELSINGNVVNGELGIQIYERDYES